MADLMTKQVNNVFPINIFEFEEIGFNMPNKCLEDIQDRINIPSIKVSWGIWTITENTNVACTNTIHYYYS